MATPGDRRFLVVVMLAAAVAITLPYVLAANSAGTGYIFGGFLLNPLDGNTYLAKIYQGWRGDWLFTLPFTAETGQGAFLYPFYLLLGHLARILRIPLLWSYHLARVLSVFVLWQALAVYLHRAVGESTIWRFVMVAAIFGSGLGWLFLPLGAFTPDFWVAEGYPFLSAYSNPHFSLSLALLLWLLLPLQSEPGKMVHSGFLAISAATLSFLSPFAVVMCVAVYIGMLFIDLVNKNTAELKENFWRLVSILAGAAIPMIYQFWVTRTDPILSGWNAQNLTPSPPLWETLVSLGVLFFVALPGIWISIRRRSRPGLLAAIWMVGALVLLYLPWDLQRRFFVGLFVPVVTLAGVALTHWTPSAPLKRLAMAGLLLSLLPTNLIVVAVQIMGAQTVEPRYFYQESEAQSYEWIENNLTQDAVILASEESGMFIPAHSGRKVVYGHPFETIQAQAKLTAVRDYFRGDLDFNKSVYFEPVDYVYLGPRERRLGELKPPSDWPIVYRNEEVVIFQVAR